MQRKSIKWQQDLLDQIPRLYDEGATRICLCAPCGAGKGFLATSITDDALEATLRTLILVNKDALVDGLVDKYERSGGAHMDNVAIIAGGRPKPDLSKPIWICSAQTLARRDFWKHLPPEYAVDIVIADECHETAFSTVGTYICEHPEDFPLVIGLTATPYRLAASQSLSQRFHRLLSGPLPKDLIPKYLVPNSTYVMLNPEATPDLSKVGTRGGEFIDADLAVACDKEELIRHAVDSWEEIAGTEQRTLVFGVNISHASNLNDEFVRRGHTSVVVTGSTPKSERREIYKKFQAGEILVLCSVDVISVGFDCVEAAVCLCCRPTKSKAKFFQIAGRVGRKSDHTGKERGIIIDQAGNALRLGTPDTITEYKFDDIREPRAGGGGGMKACPQCGMVHTNFVRQCPCGHEFPSQERIEQGGEMIDLSLLHRIERLEDKRRSSIRKWMQQAYTRGLAPGWASMKFKEAFGGWPSDDLRLHAVFAEPTTKDAADYLRYLAAVAAKKDHDRGWVVKAFECEFGTSFLASDVIAGDRLLQLLPVLRGSNNSVLAALRA